MKRRQETEIAKIIYKRMDELNIESFRKLSEISGITPVTLWKLTKGSTVKVDTLKKVSKALKLKNSILLDTL
jgi:predicted transcriptional regulator